MSLESELTREMFNGSNKHNARPVIFSQGSLGRLYEAKALSEYERKVLVQAFLGNLSLFFCQLRLAWLVEGHSGIEPTNDYHENTHARTPPQPAISGSPLIRRCSGPAYARPKAQPQSLTRLEGNPVYDWASPRTGNQEILIFVNGELLSTSRLHEGPLYEQSHNPMRPGPEGPDPKYGYLKKRIAPGNRT
ncbi:hypothetical protein OSB04_002128 [Centaurea solstitialis]|uniref:Uncharacterized protein n=1 Tax=Centaurea solstitialis TaxID=347529 RepID=A0AA38WM24_9ASTR|nr:hypothetical protein OSB04_002128 [Centaurea solstitialis]